MPTSCVSKDGSDGSYSKPDGTLYSNVVSVTEEELTGSTIIEITLDHIVPDSTPSSPGCAGTSFGGSNWSAFLVEKPEPKVVLTLCGMFQAWAMV